MIALNSGQLGYLVGKSQNITNVLFTGNYVRNNKSIMNYINFAWFYTSKGTIIPKFIKYPGYLGSIGWVEYALRK